MNLFTRFKALLPDPVLQVGTVVSVSNGVAKLSLPGGFTTNARGTGAVGTKVFFRNGAIEGAAPNLTLQVISI